MGRFLDNKDGTIRDTRTGLIWQKEDDGIERTYDEAISYCRELRIGGYSDWRLPTLEELLTIVVQGMPANIDETFTNAKPERYWTVTGYPDYKWNIENKMGLCKPETYDTAYTVDFSDGYETSYFKTYKFFVRAVRKDM